MQKKWVAVSLFIVGSLLLAAPVLQGLWSLRRAVAFMGEVSIIESASTAQAAQKFKVMRSGPFKLSWVEPYEYKTNLALENLSYSFQILSEEKTVGSGGGVFNLKSQSSGSDFNLETGREYLANLTVLGPNSKELLKGFQLKISQNQDLLLAEASSNFRILSLLSIAFFALGYVLIRKED